MRPNLINNNGRWNNSFDKGTRKEKAWSMPKQNHFNLLLSIMHLRSLNYVRGKQKQEEVKRRGTNKRKNGARLDKEKTNPREEKWIQRIMKKIIHRLLDSSGAQRQNSFF